MLTQYLSNTIVCVSIPFLVGTPSLERVVNMAPTPLRFSVGAKSCVERVGCHAAEPFKHCKDESYRLEDSGGFVAILNCSTVLMSEIVDVFSGISSG